MIWCEPLNKGIYGLSSEELVNIPLAPGSLDEAFSALKEDHEFLLKGDVFTEEEAAHLDLWAAYSCWTLLGIADPMIEAFTVMGMLS